MRSLSLDPLISKDLKEFELLARNGIRFTSYTVRYRIGITVDGSIELLLLGMAFIDNDEALFWERVMI